MTSPYDELVPKHIDFVLPKESDMNGKPLLRSKTFWINLITVVAGILTSVGGSELIQDNPQVVGVMATVIGVVNVLLRLITKEPVTSVK
jgi:hypothetical protein